MTQEIIIITIVVEDYWHYWIIDERKGGAYCTNFLSYPLISFPGPNIGHEFYNSGIKRNKKSGGISSKRWMKSSCTLADILSLFFTEPFTALDRHALSRWIW